MRLGILSDIHEHTHYLRQAIATLRQQGVDRFVVLGDLVRTGEHLSETVALLQEIDPVGVWGNHDFGLCGQPSEAVRRKYPALALDFMSRLQPRLELDGCHFTHVEPWLDPHDVSHLWYIGEPPETLEEAVRSFAAVPNTILFIGHFHRWHACTTTGSLPWKGEALLVMQPNERYLIVVGAVAEGRFAWFDTRTRELRPFQLPPNPRTQV